MSNFAMYILEKDGKQIIEDENGFATYYFIEEGCYIEDIFVVKDKRKEGIAAKYADQIADIAKKAGINTLIGSVRVEIENPTASVSVLIAYGFKVIKAEDGMIWFNKEI